MEIVMKNQWSEFTDFEIACLCHDYGRYIQPSAVESILPLKLKDRAQLEKFLTEYELTQAFGETYAN